MEQLILSNDLSDLAMDLPIKTGISSSFGLKASLIKQLLSSLYKNPHKRNVFGYLTEISAFKGIFSVMRELIENDRPLRTFLKSQLQDQYFPFEQTIRFLRNVLNHSTSSGLALKLEDFEIQREFILSPKIQKLNDYHGAVIHLDFVYSKYISERKGSPDYGIHLSLDFAALKPGILLEQLVKRHDLYLLAELCFNLSQLADAKLQLKRKRSRKAESPLKSRSKTVQSPRK